MRFPVHPLFTLPMSSPPRATPHSPADTINNELSDLLSWSTLASSIPTDQAF